jgi:hypothetical protein
MPAAIVRTRTAAFLIRIGKALVVFATVPGKTSRQGPKSPPIDTQATDHGVRKEPNHSTVAVSERVDPREAVVARSNRDYPLDAVKVRRLIAPLKMAEQRRNELVGRPDMRSYLDVSVPQFQATSSLPSPWSPLASPPAAARKTSDAVHK